MSQFQSLWSKMYLRWSQDSSLEEKAEKKAAEVFRRNKEARTNVIKLRKQVVDMMNDAIEKGLLAKDDE